jgi:hypothetical protein
MAFKIKKLADEKFDFDLLFPDKQQEVKEAYGMSFTLNEIVDFLRKQTDNFKNEYPLALDLDNAIYKVYEKYKGAQPAEEEPPVENPQDGIEVDGITAEQIEEWESAIEGLYDLLQDTDGLDKATITEWKDAMSDLVDLLESVDSYDAKKLKKYKK